MREKISSKKVLFVLLIFFLFGCSFFYHETTDQNVPVTDDIIGENGITNEDKLLPSSGLTPSIGSTSTLTILDIEIEICNLTIELVRESNRLNYLDWAGQNEYPYFFNFDSAEWVYSSNESVRLSSNELFQFLTPEIEIQSRLSERVSYPTYSISPSGKNMVFWIKPNTTQSPAITPTPAPGLVSPGKDAYFKDIYFLGEGQETPIYITRVNGFISSFHWSNEENYVYLVFDLTTYPGDFLVKVDLREKTSDVLIERNELNRTSHWIQLSPDGKRVAYSHAKEKNSIYFLNTQTKEVARIDGLPDFFVFYWLSTNWFLLLDGNENEFRFILFDITNLNIISSMEFNGRWKSNDASTKLSPDRTTLAFHGDVGTDETGISLYILRICSDE